MVSKTAGVAQTNIQLYNQMAAEGYPNEEIARVRLAYKLAMKIFSGQFRANEKPQLAHLTGVASILASLGCKGPVVAAGMLHTAYSHGDWGNGGRGRTEIKAGEIAEVLGRDTEAVIACYQSQRYTAELIRELRARVEDLSEVERNALLVELADVLEEFDDGSIAYCDHVKHGPESEDPEAVYDLTVNTANALGYPYLADHLAESLKRTSEMEVPVVAHTHLKHGTLQPPLSYRQRWRLQVKKPLGRLKRSVRRLLRSAN